MRYYKYIADGVIWYIGTGLGDDEITEQEYAEIYAVIESRPEPPQGFDYRLKADLTWELVELPPVVEEDPPVAGGGE